MKSLTHDAKSSVDVSESDFKLVGDNRVVYVPYDESCGVIPDELDGEVFGGGRLEGNICFQVPDDEGGFMRFMNLGTRRIPVAFFASPNEPDGTWLPLL